MKTAIAAYWELLAHARPRMVAAVALFGISGLLEGIGLLVLVPVIEGAVGGEVANSLVGRHLAEYFNKVDQLLTASLILFVCFGIGAAASRWGGETTLLSLRTRIEEFARRGTTRALLDADWSHFMSLRQGDIAKSLITEGLQISYGVHHFVTALGSVVITAVYLITAFAISIQMTFIALAFGSLGALAYFFAWNQAKRHSERLSEVASDLGERVADVFGNLKFVRSVGATAIAESRAAEIFGEYRKVYFLSQAYTPALRVSFELGAVVFVFGFLYWRLLVLHDAAAPALIFLVVFYRLVPRVMAVQDGLFGSATYLSWYHSWKARIDLARAHPQSPSGELQPTFDRGIEFRKVSFSYGGVDTPTLREIDITMRPGECIALVGGSGGGKSTLIDLITGLVIPQSGSILLDGQPLSRVDIDRWRARLGVVLQDSPLFHETVLENIMWGQGVRDRDRATACARQAHAWEFIERLPQGLDTPVAQRGARLSGGQRQRISIARALYHNPWLLVLDEATSALDGESEAAIQSALEEMKGKTAILMVAHRLKTVRLADRIYVIERGRVVEAGSWDELMSRQGRFVAMVSAQALEA